MNNIILNTTVYGRNMLIHLLDEKVEHAHVIPSNTEYPIGTVVLGRIKKIIPSSNACFVNIGNGCDYFFTIPKDISKLFFADGKTHTSIHNEDVLLFQIKTEAVKLKQPTVDGSISLTGQYFVLEIGSGISYSSKLSTKDKKNIILPDVIKEISDKYRVVVRTAANSVDDINVFETELVSLYESMEKIFNALTVSPDYKILYTPVSIFEQLILEWSKESVEKIITDEEINKILLSDICSTNNIDFEFYDNEFPLYKLFKLESCLDELLGSKVYLKSGAFLVVEQGETLTAIDVNSAHATKGDKESANISINMEAALEISRILKNRNISGMILIDFINMKNIENEKKLISYMKELFSLDSIRTRFVDMTGLGLMEVTRQRKYKSLKEQWKNNEANRN